jgi:isopenicillin N synthase-like dioxygenase
MTVTQNQIQYSHDESLEFPFLPPFPKDVPIAPLLRISLKKLLAHDSTEEDNLFRACRELGFFYLDVGSAADDETIDGKLLLKDVDSLFDLSEGIFKLPTKEKQSYDFNDKHSYFGYKGVGDGIIDKEGNPDRNEFWNVSKNDILGISDPIPNPEVLRKEENRALAKSYILRSHAVVTLILRILNDRLGLPEGTLQKHHRLNAISGDQVRWVRFPPQKMDEKQIAFGEHTDFGTLTLLFNRLGGLQIRLPGETEWDYVKPLKGHCVVNIGDALVKFTAGVLRSNVSHFMILDQKEGS